MTIPHPGHRKRRRVFQSNWTGVESSSRMPINVAAYVPIDLEGSRLFERIGTIVRSTPAGQFRMAIYSNQDNMPRDMLLETDPININFVDLPLQTTIAWTSPSNSRYWLGFQTTNGRAMFYATAPGVGALPIIEAKNVAEVLAPTALIQDLAWGSFPRELTNVEDLRDTDAPAPLLFLRPD